MPYPTFTSGQILTASDMNKVGLWLISTTTLSGTSVNVANCFSSDFENYRIVMSGITITGAADVAWRLRAGATTATGANYQQQTVSVSGGTSSGIADVNATSFRGALSDTTYEGQAVLDICRPNIADTTTYTFQQFGYFSGAYYFRSGGGLHTLTTAYDSINFFTLGTAMSGTARIYGYRN
jgi:hypothetical protein